MSKERFVNFDNSLQLAIFVLPDNGYDCTSLVINMLNSFVVNFVTVIGKLLSTLTDVTTNGYELHHNIEPEA